MSFRSRPQKSIVMFPMPIMAAGGSVWGSGLMSSPTITNNSSLSQHNFTFISRINRLLLAMELKRQALSNSRISLVNFWISLRVKKLATSTKQSKGTNLKCFKFVLQNWTGLLFAEFYWHRLKELKNALNEKNSYRRFLLRDLLFGLFFITGLPFMPFICFSL